MTKMGVIQPKAACRAKKELIAKERQQDREQLIEYDSMLAARAAASEAALAAIRSRSAARCAAVGDWVTSPLLSLSYLNVQVADANSQEALATIGTQGSAVDQV